MINKSFNYINKKIIFYTSFIILYFLSVYYFGSVGFIILTIIGLFLNTSSRIRNENELSAYSILNPGFRRIMGDLRLDQLERQLFNRYIEEDTNNHINNDEYNKMYSDEEMNHPISKYSNKKCPKCNSGKKYKKCCAMLFKN